MAGAGFHGDIAYRVGCGPFDRGLKRSILRRQHPVYLHPLSGAGISRREDGQAGFI